MNNWTIDSMAERIRRYMIIQYSKQVRTKRIQRLLEWWEYTKASETPYVAQR